MSPKEKQSDSKSFRKIEKDKISLDVIKVAVLVMKFSILKSGFVAQMALRGSKRQSRSCLVHATVSAPSC
jgi:hypothetical protein